MGKWGNEQMNGELEFEWAKGDGDGIMGKGKWEMGN